MPYAANPLDGVRTYFEDDGGDGQPILFYAGLGDPLEYARANELTDALRPEYRLVFADHRGHGRSDKPHDEAAYDLRTRVGDVLAVLDELRIERAHYVGLSWGARLGFALGEYAPDRVLSLILCGNQPYEWDPAWPFVPMLDEAFANAGESGMVAFLDVVETVLGSRLAEPVRSWTLDNDAEALAAAWRSARTEGTVSTELTRWQVPCLIYVGDADDMRANAERAAAEIPGAEFVVLPQHSHISAGEEAELILPYVRAVLAKAGR